MNTAEFLAHVLPSTGPYCICIQGKSGYPAYPATDLGEATTIAQDLDRKGKNVFFALGALIRVREWDEEKKYWKTARDGTNIRAVRSYILDLDAGTNATGAPRQYETVAAAATALKEFVKAAGLPKPTVTSSGNGLHVFWSMEDEVPQAEWEANGAALKLLAQGHGLLFDPGRTADSSSVLRVAGTHNYKYDPAPEVEILFTAPHIPNAKFHALLNGHSTAVLAAHGAPLVDFGSNIERYEGPPLGLREAVSHCATFARTIDPDQQRLGGAAVPEPAWLCAMMMTTHMDRGREAAHLISKEDPRYSKDYVDQKFDYLIANNIGPPTCTKFEKAYTDVGLASLCTKCPSYQKIKSPAVIAKHVAKAPPLVVQEETQSGTVITRTISEPPSPFIRTKRGAIGLSVGNPKTGVPDIVEFCDYDMYPIRLRYDERTLLEDDVVWRVKLPKEEWIDVEIPHAATNQMRTILAKRGVYIDELHIPHMTKFMSSYMRKLQTEIPREMAFSKLGWRKDGGFVVGDTLYLPDGSNETHCISHALKTATEGGMKVAGDYDTWRQEVQKYNRDGLEGYRVYLYSTFGSVFYHMTGQIATCISATGVTGLGKSTLMDVCASVWGDPTLLMIRGAKDLSTRAAAEVRANSMHHLPVWMDEVTARDAKDVAELIFNYSGGKGKIRSTAAGGIRADTATWSNILLVNANTDEYERISSIFRDSSQHLMRLIQIDFGRSDTITKAEGDMIRNIVREHFGHAGRIFAEYIVQHHDKIKRRVREVNIEVDRRVNAKPEERFWTAAIACNIVAADICNMLGILQGFPITNDTQWMLDQVEILRKHTNTQMLVPGEILSEFLDARLPNTLTLGTKGSGNIDNMILEPRGELQIRYEVDNETIYLSRNAFREYCAEHNVNFNRTMDEMEQKGYVRRYSVMKVLGADTCYSKGKVRCIEIDVTKLSGKLAAVSTAAPVPIPLNAKSVGKP